VEPEDNIGQIRKRFEDQILSKPIIFDDDFDSYLCLAYINSKLNKKIKIGGIKKREKDGKILGLFDWSRNALFIKSFIDWKDCSFLDFEIHGCPSIGQHMLLKYEENILNPNKEKGVVGDQEIGIKYPMSTIIYLLYLYGDLENYSEDQWKFIAIPDKTYQNSWKYQNNFKNWEKKLNFKFNLSKILKDKEFYDKLNKKFPHIYNKYPPMDAGGKELLKIILKKLEWELPTLPLEGTYTKYYLIPERITNVSVDNIPDDVFHHARLNREKMWVSKKSDILFKENIINK
jgi:hypothetical protein